MLKTTYLHSNWEFAEEGWLAEEFQVGTITPTWLAAQVPGHVHLDLVANGVIADPFVRMNELGCQWVDERDWRYRTRFEYHAKEDLPRRVLSFEGLDTIATILLNGVEIGHSRNMFVPAEFDVSNQLKEGTNELEIRFKSALKEGKALRESYLKAEEIPDNVRNFDERAFVRKAQYMYGWDWGPKLVSCGIWKPVRLIEYTARILDIHITQTLQDDDSITVRVSAEIEGDAMVVFGFFGDTEINQTGPDTFHIPKPELWWPHDAGDQTVYFLSTALVDDNGEVLDQQGRVIGLRTIELIREPDQFGESFEFAVNGERLWIKGANWIPDHSFPSVVNEQRYRERIEDAQKLGCNMLRVWGGGLYEADEFYLLCDEMGILVWQDFPFACSYYPEDEQFQREVVDEALVNIKRLRNHASLAIWCGNNENHAMWHGKWGGLDRSPSRYYGLELYRQALPALLAKVDPSRPYVESSPVQGTTQSDEIDPGLGGFGDQHCWDVWHGRGDWRFYADSTTRFCSEYGFASSCHSSVWSKTLDPGEEDPQSAAVRWHDKTGKGWEKFLSYIKLHYPEPKSLEEWVYYSQLNQRDAIRFGLEHYRRSEFCRGSLIWQLNDCWPVQSWALIDFEGNYKAAAYELRRLHRNLLCSLVRDKDRFELWAINDGIEERDEGFRLSVLELSSGRVLRSERTESVLGWGVRKKVLEISIEGLAVPDLLIVGGHPGNETWQLAAEPKNARLAPAGPITISTYPDEALEILVEHPIVDLFLTSDGSTLPFEDNFLTIARPGVIDVELRGPVNKLAARSLAGVHPIKMVRGPLG